MGLTGVFGRVAVVGSRVQKLLSVVLRDQIGSFDCKHVVIDHGVGTWAGGSVDLLHHQSACGS